MTTAIDDKNTTTKLQRLFAPGIRRVDKFSIKMSKSPDKGNVEMDWQSFRTSKKVQSQLKAAKGFKVPHQMRSGTDRAK